MHPPTGAHWRRRPEEKMDISMRMVLVAGMLMLALLVAIVGMVSADSVKWEPAPAVANAPTAGSQPL
jgi:hypothetical protein